MRKQEKQHSGKIWGGGNFSPTTKESREEKDMYTVSDIIAEIDRGCLSHNMIEDRFSYRIIFFVNEGSSGTKHYIDTTYGDLRKSLENIIKGHLTVTNSVVIGGQERDRARTVVSHSVGN